MNRKNDFKSLTINITKIQNKFNLKKFFYIGLLKQYTPDPKLIKKIWQ